MAKNGLWLLRWLRRSAGRLDELLDAAAREMIKKKAREHVQAKRRAEVEKLALDAADPG